MKFCPRWIHHFARFWGVLFFLATSVPVFAQTIVINELQSSNAATLADEDGDFSDWIEIFNTTQRVINLSGYGLSDNPENLDKWKFPQGTSLGPSQYLVVFASGKNRNNPRAPLHTSYNLSADGEAVVLSDSSGAIIDQTSFGFIGRDNSWGRQPNATGDFIVLTRPTPGVINDNLGRVSSPVFSLPAGFYSGPQTVALTTDVPGAIIRYTTDGVDPHERSPLYIGPIPLSRTTVIRARAFKSGFVSSQSVTRTFFIDYDAKGLTVVSLATDPDNLWHPEFGIYTEGEGPDEPNYMVPRQERPFHLELFDESGIRQLGQNGGVRVVGASSRNLLPKSIGFWARSRYDAPGSFKYQIFPQKNIKEFEGFIARNSSQDGHRYSDDPSFRRTFLRGGLHVNLIRDLNMDFRDYRPAIIFWNGQFWGLQNLREKFNNHYINDNHPEVDTEDVDMVFIGTDPLENFDFRPDNEILVMDYFGIARIENDEGTKQSVIDFVNLVAYMRDHNLAEKAHFDYVRQFIDLENFADYYATQIYVANADWPTNNIRFWRDRTVGKWRAIIYDLDMGFGLQAHASWQYDALKAASQNSPIFQNLIKNAEFRRLFLQRMEAALNGPFHPDRVIQVVDQLTATIDPIMDIHLKRWWGNVFKYSDWKNNVEVLRDFARRRPAKLREQIQSFFTEVRSVSLVEARASDPLAGDILVNGGVVDSVRPEGTYFNNIPIRFEARPRPGYLFVEWKKDGLTVQADQDGSLTIIPPGVRQVLAVFMVDAVAAAQIVINEVSSEENWIELYNQEEQSVDLGGWAVSDDAGQLQRQILPAGSVIAPKGFLAVDLIGFGLKSDGSEPAILTNNAGITVQDIVLPAIEDGKTWGRMPDGTGNFKILNVPTKGASNTDQSSGDDDLAGIVINEVDSNGKPEDWVELKNTTQEAVRLNGAYLRDSGSNRTNVPNNTTIPAGGYLVLELSGISRNGEAVFLYDSNNQIQETVVVPSLKDGQTYGRIPDGTGSFRVLNTPTRGRLNQTDIADAALPLKIGIFRISPGKISGRIFER